ncbi:bacteriophage tail assembly protein [Desulfocurvibacter africanus PCS]|uniref:Bacteriophage tail assembly protein n=1 Tax=Desulfocurvibacter africanus PCS TaxID=1262666 RepID=M5Q1J3_DESAF|nr:phage terminase large subunit family protein [Desulfocurvibacter africanus]EMG36603.1 bacteriophage tail assembly protein [Desulfocurvibacter africanus PCS]
MAPRPKLTLSEWADRYAYLSAENSSEPGKWKTLPFQRGLLDLVTDDTLERISIMKSARVGYTKLIDHAVGFFIHHDPSPIMVVQPTIEDAEGYSKEEIAPMLRDTPVLSELAGDPKSKTSNNTILKKQFPGCSLTLVGANSPRGFRRVTKRVVAFDEVDGYPPGGAGSEGDQIALGIKRTLTFWNRKIIEGSTPTIKGESRIEHSFEQGDQRRYFVPCPGCGWMQPLRWANLQWDKELDAQGNVIRHMPETAHYVCEHCGECIPESRKNWMVAQGEWRPTAEPKKKGHASAHIWAAYSPFPNASWPRLVEEFLEAKDSPERLQVFVNTILGETWEEGGEKADTDSLLSRCEVYNAQVPLLVGVLSAGVDVQDDRFEIEVLGWGADHESWNIDYRVIYGDLAQPEIWKELDDYLLTIWEHESGRKIRISAVCLDSGGHFTQEAYRFCKPRWGRRVYAIKGGSSKTGPLVSKPSTSNNLKCPLFTLNVGKLKDVTHARLRIKRREHEVRTPGYCHFPVDRDEDYFKGLTSEKRVTRYVKGHPVREWVKPSGVRNEPWDCRQYATAAQVILNPNMQAVLERMQTPEGDAGAAQAQNPKAKPQPRTIRSNFMKR